MSSPNAVSVGYNVRLDDTKINDTLIPDGQPFPYSGVDSATDYSDRITITAVDRAGNETPPVSLRALGKTLITADPTPSDLLPQDKRDAIDAFVAAQLKPNTKVDGAVLGISTPEGSYYRAYGGDRTANSPLTIDDKMRYGSITKMYTCLLVLIYIDAGRLSFDDNLSQFVDGVANGDKVTVKNLLMMNSGIKDYLQQDPSVQQSYFLSPTTAFDPMPKILSYAPLYEPGESSSYSNSNTFLLGKILERIDAEHGTGRDIRTMIYEDILAPLGLTETEWPTGNYMTAPYARGWTDNLALSQIQAVLGPLSFLAGLLGYPTAEEIEFTACSTTWGDAAGALDGTVADLVKFGQAIASGALISPEMKQLREETFVTYVAYEPAHPWEGEGWMGFGLGVIQWGSWLGWIGSLAGYHSVMFANPSNGAVIAAIVNHMTSGDPVTLFYQIAYLLYPETTLIQPGTVRFGSFTTTAQFGDMRVFRYEPPGDEDGNTSVPLKVPFYI